MEYKGVFNMRILHLLEMNVKDIEKQIPKISECGFTHVQIGNICPLKSDMYNNELNRKYGYKCGRKPRKIKVKNL